MYPGVVVRAWDLVGRREGYTAPLDRDALWRVTARLGLGTSDLVPGPGYQGRRTSGLWLRRVKWQRGAAAGERMNGSDHHAFHAVKWQNERRPRAEDGCNGERLDPYRSSASVT